MMENNSTENLVFSKVITPVISPKFKSTTNFLVPNFSARQFYIIMKFNPGVIKKSIVP